CGCVLLYSLPYKSYCITPTPRLPGPVVTGHHSYQRQQAGWGTLTVLRVRVFLGRPFFREAYRFSGPCTGAIMPLCGGHPHHHCTRPFTKEIERRWIAAAFNAGLLRHWDKVAAMRQQVACLLKF